MATQPPFVTLNNMSVPVPPAFPTLTGKNSGFTPMLLTTDSNGMQTLTTMSIMQSPLSLSSPGLMPQFYFDPSGMAIALPSMPLVMTPSPSPLPMLMPQTNLCGDHSASNVDRWSLSASRERDILGDIESFESERPMEPKVAVTKQNKFPTPALTEDMTKKDVVNFTLDWFYAVLGSDHFDCEGRRGANVLRIKVKTRGALEYICPLIDQCIEEGLLHHVSCPISTKKKRRHIRGYLAYLEAVSEEAADRVIEVFNEVNKVLVNNCDGAMEHPFKGISRNPIAVRAIKTNFNSAA